MCICWWWWCMVGTYYIPFNCPSRSQWNIPARHAWRTPNGDWHRHPDDLPAGWVGWITGPARLLVIQRGSEAVGVSVTWHAAGWRTMCQVMPQDVSRLSPKADLHHRQISRLTDEKWCASEGNHFIISWQKESDNPNVRGYHLHRRVPARGFGLETVTVFSAERRSSLLIVKMYDYTLPVWYRVPKVDVCPHFSTLTESITVWSRAVISLPRRRHMHWSQIVCSGDKRLESVNKPRLGGPCLFPQWFALFNRLPCNYLIQFRVTGHHWNWTFFLSEWLLRVRHNGSPVDTHQWGHSCRGRPSTHIRPSGKYQIVLTAIIIIAITITITIITITITIIIIFMVIIIIVICYVMLSPSLWPSLIIVIIIIIIIVITTPTIIIVFVVVAAAIINAHHQSPSSTVAKRKWMCIPLFSWFGCLIFVSRNPCLDVHGHGKKHDLPLWRASPIQQLRRRADTRACVQRSLLVQLSDEHVVQAEVSAHPVT